VYSSPLQAKIAAELASDNIKKDPADREPSESEVVDALTELVEDAPAEDTVDAIQEIAQSGELVEALDALEGAAKGEVAASSEKEAIYKIKQAQIAYRFLAKLAAEKGQISSNPTIVLPAVNAQEDPRPDNYANAGGAPIQKKVDGDVAANASTHKLDPKAVSQGIDVEAKHAAWLLRKLAGGAAVSSDSSEIIGKGSAPAQHDDRPPEYANNGGDPILPLLDLKSGHNTNEAVPHPNSENGTVRQDKEVLAYLIRKTAAEVGHFLPSNLSSRDKVAALRTMIGMDNSDRAVYLGRIKQAADAVDAKQNKKIEENAQEIAEIEKELKAQEEEKEAAYMLRQLGIGI
tara:strand:- start:47 stop:1084 length:1038 start_codon:yes stop_codon:yes gene_type:complete